jgi:XisI protein
MEFRITEAEARAMARLEEEAGCDISAGVEECVSFDEVRDQYLWFSVGWDGKRRDFGVTVYMRIEQGKIWVEEDWTKQGMVDELLEMGVPAEDIVLGFQHPSKRPLTEFAAA